MFDDLNHYLGNYTIKEAFLELYFEEYSFTSNVNDTSSEMKMLIRLFTTSWDEDGATWFKATDASNWNTIGVGDGDIDETFSYKVTYHGSKEKVWHSFDVFTWVKKSIGHSGVINSDIPIIQNMIDIPTKNFGFFIVGDDAREFIYTSSQSGNKAHRPRLRIIVEESVAIDGLQSNLQESHITLDRNNKLINFNNVDGQELTIKIYSSNGSSMPVILSKSNSKITCNYSGLSNGVYFVHFTNRITNQEKVIKIASF